MQEPKGPPGHAASSMASVSDDGWSPDDDVFAAIHGSDDHESFPDMFDDEAPAPRKKRRKSHVAGFAAPTAHGDASAATLDDADASADASAENEGKPFTNLRAPKGEPSLAPSNKPRVIVTADIHVAMRDATVALAAAPNVFCRVGRLCRMVRIAEADMVSGVAVGSPAIFEMSSPTILATLTELCEFFYYTTGGGLKHRSPHNELVSAIREMREWEGVKPVTGITETPIVRSDGFIRTEPGYDNGTGYIYVPSVDVPAIPEAPTQADAMRALTDLLEPFQEFPYRGDADRYVPIAAILTLLARPAIAGVCPMFLFDASTPGSGKSLQCHVISTIVYGREAALATWPVEDEELEKMLAAAAMASAAMLTFDNCSRSIGGDALDKVLTATRVSLRVLGRSEIPEFQWRAVIMASGNNLDIKGDTARRVLLSRLEPSVERPEDRQFAIPDLLGWTRENRARLIAAGLTMLRAWFLAGRPPAPGAPWGRFEAWDQIVNAAIVFAGGCDVRKARPVYDSERASAVSDLVALLDGVEHMTSLTGPITGRAMCAALYPDGRPPRGDAPPDGHDGLREALEAACRCRPGTWPTPHQVGLALAKVRGRVAGARRLDSEAGSGGKPKWRVTRL